ncbi:Hypothetical protein CINCED_3A018840 [Cinara cedri]|uniref:Uncharacterized protein n=1 Tax=Cinara cedri TaxID=506608 RepID=A0A5E4NQN3_9HEMI|nr:Hypothetical protein CINCED_3A018840 [Cinara cedri]
MDLFQFQVIVVLIICYEQFSDANNVNVPNERHPADRSRPKKSVDTEIYVALPPDTTKTGKLQNSPPTLIRLDPNSPNRFKGKFPTPIERFIQRIQNYFSVYNPPEYLNDLQRPGINNPEHDEDQVNPSNDTQIILPCNGTSTIVIIPMPLENENLSSDQNINPDKLEVYSTPTTLKSDCPDEVTTTKPKCPNETTPKPVSYTKETTTIKPNCPEMTTPKPDCPEVTTPKPDCPEVTTPKPNCPEVTTPKPNCPEVTTPKPNCPEVTTPKPNCPEVTTPKHNCPEITTPKPKCPEVTTPKPKSPTVTTPKSKYPEVSTPKPECQEATFQKSPCPPKQILISNEHKPVSDYGPSEVPPLNLVAQPILGSTVVYFYKNPSTLPPPNSPAYFGDEYPRKPKSPILRLKQLLFPRLYAAFHPED